MQDSKRFKDRLDISGIKSAMLPLNRLSKERKQIVKYIFFFLYEVYILYRVLKREKINIVHVSGGSWQYKGVIAGRLAGCRVLWHLNDTKSLNFIELFFKLIANKFAHGFIVAAKKVEEYYLNELRITPHKPVFQIQAPVDCSLFNPTTVDPDKRISVLKGIHIVTVANINQIKGVEYFLEIVKELNKTHSNLNFWIIGSPLDSQKRYYENLIKFKKNSKLDNCHFYGASNNIKRILKSADIYVCTSIREASPLSVWEAMSMEKAIVSTDVGDVSRFIKDGENGYIVESCNGRALAQKVKLLVDNPKTCDRFGKLARRTALEHLDLKICVEAHRNAYIKMADWK
jgi:glycosyltransferase involved in cell wall biosynthesis